MFKFRFGKFLITNLIGTTIDTIVIFIFKKWIFHSYLGIYVLSPIIGFEVAVINNYTISFFWVWHDRVKHKTFKEYFKRIFLYDLTAITAFTFRLLLIVIISRIFIGLDVIWCNLIALLFSGAINYFGGDKLIFKRKVENYF